MRATPTPRSTRSSPRSRPADAGLNVLGDLAVREPTRAASENPASARLLTLATHSRQRQTSGAHLDQSVTAGASRRCRHGTRRAGRDPMSGRQQIAARLAVGLPSYGACRVLTPADPTAGSVLPSGHVHAHVTAIGHASHARQTAGTHDAPRSMRHLVPDPASPDGQRSVGESPEPAGGRAARPATRARTRAMLVSTTADVAFERERQHRPGRVLPDARQRSSTSSVDGNSPARTISITAAARAGCWRGAGSRVPATTAARRRATRPAHAAGVGYAAMNARHFGITRGACVCCSITSLTRIAHGSRVRRHGRSRSRGRPHCRAPCGQSAGVALIVVRPSCVGWQRTVALPHHHPAAEVAHLLAVLVEALASRR